MKRGLTVGQAANGSGHALANARVLVEVQNTRGDEAAVRGAGAPGSKEITEAILISPCAV